MLLLPFLQVLDGGLDPAQIKVHLASWNGVHHPLNVFLDGGFEEWQSWQRKRNFERPIVLSLVALPASERWLFVGAFDVLGRSDRPEGDGKYRYELARRYATDELVGRLVVAFRRTGRASYLRAERWAGLMSVAEVYAERLSVGPFPGFSRVHLTKGKLDLVVKHGAPSWVSALGSVGGVYLVADGSTGKLYVGSATGGGGIWARWCAYSATGHGGNVDLKALLADRGPDHAQHLRFAVLETADTKTSREEVLARESHWKRVLLSREHGHNAN